MKIKTTLIFLFLFAYSFIFAQTNISSLGNSAIFQAAAAPGGGGNEPMQFNAINFEYDSAGNQIKRYIIYLPPRMSNPNGEQTTEVKEEDFIKTEPYPEISYFPNPVSSELFLKWEDTEFLDLQKIELYDLTGKLYRTYNDQSRSDNATIDFEAYPSGVYNLVLRYNNGEFKTLKIVKQ